MGILNLNIIFKSMQIQFPKSNSVNDLKTITQSHDTKFISIKICGRVPATIKPLILIATFREVKLYFPFDCHCENRMVLQDG
jgi:hypothetical protein